MNIRLCLLVLLLAVAATLTAGASLAAPASHVGVHRSYIVVRLDKVWVLDDEDGVQDGEIQYLSVVATGNRDEEPIALQKTGFPLENWYEAEDGSTNAVFMEGHERAVPLFAYPEAHMGDELVITFTVLDDDEVGEGLIIAHGLAAVIGTGVATAMAGPQWGALVGTISNSVHNAIVDGGEKDEVGTHVNRLRRADNFGMPVGEHSVQIDQTEGGMRLIYTVMRVSVPEQFDQWCVSVTLNRVRIMEDGDGFPNGEGEIYIRARAANGYAGEVLSQRTTHLPANGTTDVDSGDDFPTRDRQLYFNDCRGLPPFLYVEVDVFEEDDTSPDDTLGVLPLMYTNRWLREHPGTHQPGTDGHTYYQVTGSTPSARKARIYLTIEIWDPNGAIQ